MGDETCQILMLSVLHTKYPTNGVRMSSEDGWELKIYYSINLSNISNSFMEIMINHSHLLSPLVLCLFL